MAAGSFPDGFPTDCPPRQAGDANGTACRSVRAPPLRDDDFRSYAELGLLPSADACRRHGLSVFRSFQEARHQQNLRPWLGGFISAGTLDSSAGKTMLTNPKTGHITWWPYAGIDRKVYFAEPEPCL